MMKAKRFSIIALIGIMVFTLIIPIDVLAAEDEVLKISIEDAVELGLENSIDLKIVKNEIEMSEEKEERAKETGKMLYDYDKQLIGGKSRLIEKSTQLENAKDAGLLNPDQIDAAIDQLKQAIDSINDAEGELDAAVNQVVNNITDQIGMSGPYRLDVPSVRKLMTTITKISADVTEQSYDIFKNQIALLIKKSYYDVMKNEKILKVKEKALERAKKQYELAKSGYEEGMKSKDEMLMAKVYYTGMELEVKKAKSELNLSLIELKKNINIPLDTEIILMDELSEELEEIELEKDIGNGLRERLEIKKAKAEKEIQDLNFEFVSRNYNKYTTEYKESRLLRQRADLNLEKTETIVESDIRKSYDLVKSTGEMLEAAKDMIEKSTENLDIAKYKYDEGFGVETSFLKKLDLESAAGTIVEVLAAEENLVQIEEKYVEILYSYNLAKMKYYNDSGKLIY